MVRICGKNECNEKDWKNALQRSVGGDLKAGCVRGFVWENL